VILVGGMVSAVVRDDQIPDLLDHFGLENGPRRNITLASAGAIGKIRNTHKPL
jgi:hypothetical protein